MQVADIHRHTNSGQCLAKDPHLVAQVPVHLKLDQHRDPGRPARRRRGRAPRAADREDFPPAGRRELRHLSPDLGHVGGLVLLELHTGVGLDGLLQVELTAGLVLLPGQVDDDISSASSVRQQGGIAQITDLLADWSSTAADPEAAEMMGININAVIVLTFAIGSAMGAVAGILFAINYNSIDPFMGFNAGLKAFTAAVLGGIGNIYGVIIGALILGFVQNFGIFIDFAKLINCSIVYYSDLSF